MSCSKENSGSKNKSHIVSVHGYEIGIDIDTSTDLIKLVYIVTHPVTARNLLRGQLSYFRNIGFDVSVVSSPGKDLNIVASEEDVTAYAVSMKREISYIDDCLSLVRLCRILIRVRPDIVNASTPKAGLLGILAARVARVPVRIYTLRGLRAETKTGLQRWILASSERLIYRYATRILCVSQSLKQLYCSFVRVSDHKIVVLGSGSSNGVDVRRFAMDLKLEAEIERLRHVLALPAHLPVIGYVGRLVRDKGIIDLHAAFEIVRKEFSETRLLVIGDFEAGDPLPNSLVMKLKEDPQVICVGPVEDPLPYYFLMHFLAFPSYREGFPNGPLEAAAAGVPTVGYVATGTKDAVMNESTGLLVEQGNVTEFAKAMSRYLFDRSLRTAHGEAAKKRVARDFQNETIWKAIHEEYKQHLATKSHER